MARMLQFDLLPEGGLTAGDLAYIARKARGKAIGRQPLAVLMLDHNGREIPIEGRLVVRTGAMREGEREQLPPVTPAPLRNFGGSRGRQSPSSQRGAGRASKPVPEVKAPATEEAPAANGTADIAQALDEAKAAKTARKRTTTRRPTMVEGI